MNFFEDPKPHIKTSGLKVHKFKNRRSLKGIKVKLENIFTWDAATSSASSLSSPQSSVSSRGSGTAAGMVGLATQKQNKFFSLITVKYTKMWWIKITVRLDNILRQYQYSLSNRFFHFFYKNHYGHQVLSTQSATSQKGG